MKNVIKEIIFYLITIELLALVVQNIIIETGYQCTQKQCLCSKEDQTARAKTKRDPSYIYFCQYCQTKADRALFMSGLFNVYLRKEGRQAYQCPNNKPLGIKQVKYHIVTSSLFYRTKKNDRRIEAQQALQTDRRKALKRLKLLQQLQKQIETKRKEALHND